MIRRACYAFLALSVGWLATCTPVVTGGMTYLAERSQAWADAHQPDADLPHEDIVIFFFPTLQGSDYAP